MTAAQDIMRFSVMTTGMKFRFRWRSADLDGGLCVTVFSKLIIIRS